MPYKGSEKNKADKARWQREWRRANPLEQKQKWAAWEIANGHDRKLAARRLHLRQYCITPEDYNRMRLAQGFCCAACGLRESESDNLVVDHCHTSGNVRGLLHRTCNSALGLFRDDAILLRKAAEYLEKYNAVEEPKTGTLG